MDDAVRRMLLKADRAFVRRRELVGVSDFLSVYEDRRLGTAGKQLQEEPLPVSAYDTGGRRYAV